MVFGYRAVAIAALGFVWSAPSAFAQAEPGVTLDPGSPAAKEYALPIEQARRDAGGDRGRGPTGTRAPAAPSFGEGIRPDIAQTTKRRSAGAGRSAKSSGKERARRFTPSQRERAKEGVDRALTMASINHADSSEGSLVLLLGGGIVMVLGVALGWLLRRRRMS